MKLSRSAPDLLVLSRPQLTNVGDVAIARSISKAVCELKNWSIGVLSIDNPDSWKLKSRRGILIGGGSIASADVIRAASVAGTERKVVLWGVEVFGDAYEVDWTGILETTVRTCRSVQRAKELGCANPKIAPDSVWLSRDFDQGNRVVSTRSTLGINATCWPKDLYFKGLTSVLAKEEMDKLVAFVIWLRAVVQNALRQGWRIKFVPFELDDYYFCKYVVQDLLSTRVEVSCFSNNPTFVQREMRGCDLFVATRYHAHIFALKAQIPLISVPYSFQAASFGKEFKLPADKQYPQFIGDELNTMSGFVLDAEAIRMLHRKCVDSLMHALNALVD